MFDERALSRLLVIYLWLLGCCLRGGSRGSGRLRFLSNRFAVDNVHDGISKIGSAFKLADAGLEEFGVADHPAENC